MQTCINNNISIGHFPLVGKCTEWRVLKIKPHSRTISRARVGGKQDASLPSAHIYLGGVPTTFKRY